MPIERILITVKTYPTLSRKYGELVCTAGIRPDGTWVRLYPIPFRRLDEPDQFAKFDWIEAELVKNQSDPRPETHRLFDRDVLRVVDHVGTTDSWRERRHLLLTLSSVFDRLQPLLDGAKANSLSLAVFKPTTILDFFWEPCEREWKAAKIAALEQQAAQGDLFESAEWRETFRLMPKLPYTFSYCFADADGRKSTMQVLDWEVGQLFWNCLKTSAKQESVALEKVRQKYFNEFLQQDLHFFLGTTQQFHFVAPNPWVIVGVFPIPPETQLRLL
jgi:hypothetical protein